MLPALQENILSDEHINLLDRFERDVGSYDKISEFSMVMSSVGVICSILVPLALYQVLDHGNPYSGITVFPFIYWIIGGILTTVLLTRVVIIYTDIKKHHISRTKYLPITGFCMCDLSILRSHAKKLERASTMGERLRHVKLVNYYSEKIIRQKDSIAKLRID